MTNIKKQRFHPILAVAMAAMLFASCVQAATKWEYKVVSIQGGAGQILNQLGADGWELVCVQGNAAYLKRPLE